MTIRHLSIFIAVAETGSMSDAAKKLYVSQPTVSQSIRELEEHYQVLLFERLGRRLFITETGRELLKQAYQVTDDFRRLNETMEEHKRHPIVRIGSSMTVGTCITPTVVHRLKQEIPNLEVYSAVSNTREIEQKLLRAELDVAFVEGNVNAPELKSIAFADDALVLACGPNHPFFRRDTLSPHELRDRNFVFRESGSMTRALFESYLSKRNLSVRVAWEVNCPRTILSAVLEDDALAVISARLIRHLLVRGRIKAFRNETGEWDRAFKLVYHQKKAMTEELQALTRIVSDYRPASISEYCMGTLTGE